MALEPITRKEKIIAGQDLTPITRMEKFLKNFGGSGGGAGAQPDLSQTDTTKPDYVKGVIRKESLPEGYPYKEITTILDGTFEFIDASGGIYGHQITDENFPIVYGKSYTIIWDGETYQCVATTIGNGQLVLGNLSFFGTGTDTGEPFLFVDQGHGKKMIATNDTAATHTVTVRREIVYHIASEFLPELTSPNGTKYKLTVSDDGTLSAVAQS